MTNTTIANSPKSIETQSDFKVGASLTGENVALDYYPYTYGSRLNDDENAKLEADAKDGIIYIVHSYNTPIGWIKADGTTYVVQQKFSVTTSKHQAKVGYGFTLWKRANGIS